MAFDSRDNRFHPEPRLRPQDRADLTDYAGSGFGGPITTSSYAVICGRDSSLRDDVERKRFAHRRSSLKVEGHPALVMTYDEMVRAMEDSLAVLKTWI